MGNKDKAQTGKMPVLFKVWLVFFTCAVVIFIFGLIETAMGKYPSQMLMLFFSLNVYALVATSLVIGGGWLKREISKGRGDRMK